MAGSAPANAAGFNVYVGTALAGMTLQNDVPLPAGGSFTYLPGTSASPQTPGTGQSPDFIRPLPAVIMRG